MLLLTALLASPFQMPLATEHDGSRFGRAVLTLGDLNDDGHREIAVGAPTAKDEVGRVLVLSGADRTVLQTWSGEDGRRTFGHTLRSAGDVDGDGLDDVIVGYESGLRTEVRSGKSGERLVAFDRRSDDVHALGDLDGDGRPELLVVSEHGYGVRSGVDGHFFTGASWPITSGSFRSVGDVNGDGLTDGVLIGEERSWLLRTERPEDGEPPSDDWKLFGSRAPLSEVWPLALSSMVDVLTIDAAPAGDLDGDGRADLMIAFATPVRPPDDLGGKMTVVALSVAEPKAALWSKSRRLAFESGRSHGFGYASVVPGDLNGDGNEDLVLSEAIVFWDVVVAGWSPFATDELWKRKTRDVGYLTGVSLAVYDDVDEDGITDILVGQSDWYWHGPVGAGGSVTLISGKSGAELWKAEEASYGPHLSVEPPEEK